MKGTHALIVITAFATIASILGAFQRPASGADTPPPWAYPVTASGGGGGQAAEDDGSPKRVPGSPVALTLPQIRDLFNVPDWHPNDHPPLADVVAHGRRPDVWACGFCHLPNGLGRPENSGLAGLPAAYIIQQMADFQNGSRKSAEPDMRPPAFMIRVAQAANDAEIQAAAAYFASVPFTAWIRVVETDTVPTTHVARGMLVSSEDGGTEPIGRRIIELPEDLARTELRDAASGFVAYVPAWTIGEGEALVKTGGNGKTVACGVCHGEDLRGRGPVPPIAGRSPSYTVRQLFDMQQGVRHGLWADLMEDVVADLTAGRHGGDRRIQRVSGALSENPEKGPLSSLLPSCPRQEFWLRPARSLSVA